MHVHETACLCMRYLFAHLWHMLWHTRKLINMHIEVCVYVYIYITHIHTWTYAYMYMCTHNVDLSTHIHIYLYLFYVYIYMYKCIYLFLSTHIYANIVIDELLHMCIFVFVVVLICVYLHSFVASLLVL